MRLASRDSTESTVCGSTCSGQGKRDGLLDRVGGQRISDHVTNGNEATHDARPSVDGQPIKVSKPRSLHPRGQALFAPLGKVGGKFRSDRTGIGITRWNNAAGTRIRALKDTAQSEIGLVDSNGPNKWSSQNAFGAEISMFARKRRESARLAIEPTGDALQRCRRKD